MLIQCPECELPISEKAISCPHCGYPMSNTITIDGKRRPYDNKKLNRRRRLPNGFGQISEIKGRNLRKPFRAMITVGKTETGRPICKPLKPVSFFETYNDAYSALVAYNKDPYDLDKGISLEGIYEKWSEKYYETCNIKMSNKSQNAWKRCEKLHSMPIKDIKIMHIKSCMDEIPADKPDTKAHLQKDLRCLLNKLFNYAIEYGLLEQNIMTNLKLGKEFNESVNHVEKGHKSFSAAELNTLWENVDNDYAKLVLIECYSGWRPSEMCDLLKSNVNLDTNIMVGGMKTEAGKNRKVPIHSKIRELVEYFYNRSDSEYLFTHNGNRLTYRVYRSHFKIVLNILKFDTTRTPHDCRKTFVTLAKKYKVDEYAIKRIVGHTITDLTEEVYTERDDEWLVSEISKIGVETV